MEIINIISIEKTRASFVKCNRSQSKCSSFCRLVEDMKIYKSVEKVRSKINVNFRIYSL